MMIPPRWIADAEIAQRRVPPFGIVEAPDVVEHVSLGVVSCPVRFHAVLSVFSDEKKLSIAALSHTLQAIIVNEDK